MWLTIMLLVLFPVSHTPAFVACSLIPVMKSGGCGRLGMGLAYSWITAKRCLSVLKILALSDYVMLV